MVFLTFGKHKNDDIKLVPGDYLKWISESFAAGKVRDMVDVELEGRSGVSVGHKELAQKHKPAKAKRTIQDSVNGSHYSWIDRAGVMHWIPRDVQLSIGQSEQCPF